MDDIINYVTNTPENTNPNVLRGLLEAKGSNNSILIVNRDENGVLDKTWQEIYDAPVAFTKVQMDGEIHTSLIYSVYGQDTNFSVVDSDYTYTSDSRTGYPVSDGSSE